MASDQSRAASDRSRSGPPLLEIRDLSVTLGSEPILDKVRMDIAPGTIHALIGPNGAGKTTLIRAVMGGMPHRGSIRFFYRESGRIGYVPQLLDFDRSWPITVGDFFALMLRRRPAIWAQRTARRNEIRQALERTECGRLIDRQIGGLSGGELRRVLLAQALIPIPEFLILDEPSSSVDEYGARLFERMLVSLRSDHRLTVLIVAHDLAMIRRVADTATVMNRRVTFQGEAAALEDSALVARAFGQHEGPDRPGGSRS